MIDLNEINSRIILGMGMLLLAVALFLNFFAKFPDKKSKNAK